MWTVVAEKLAKFLSLLPVLFWRALQVHEEAGLSFQTLFAGINRARALGKSYVIHYRLFEAEYTESSTRWLC